MNLLELYLSNVTLYNTDKETTHCYISEIYDYLFKNYKYNSKILEIGIQEGYSINLWSDYFQNSKIYGIEIDSNKLKIPIFGKNYKILIEDAYSNDFIKSISEKFDIIIDDGPHCVNSQKIALEKYFNLLNDGGILVIEDIANIETAYYLMDYAKNFLLFDLRAVKNRFDDIALVCYKK